MWLRQFDSLELTCQPLFATMAINSKGFPLWVLSLLAFPRLRKREGGVDLVTGIIRPVPLERDLGVNRRTMTTWKARVGSGINPADPGQTTLNPIPTSVTYRNFVPGSDGCLPGE
jgi:hypothetical protein